VMTQHLSERKTDMLINKKNVKEFILQIAQDKDPRAAKWSRVSSESLDVVEAAVKQWINTHTEPQHLPRVGRTIKL